jgi:YVTN family beta-propeller protein
MRLRRIALVTTTAVVAGLSSILGPAAVAARADPAAVPLPIPRFAHMVVDSVHQHVFFSEGVGNNGILVTDFNGATVATIPNEPGSDGMTLSPDGSTLYVALHDGDAVAAIDTSTLTETQRYSLGSGSVPLSVAYAGGKVWVGYGGDARGNIGSIDPSTTPATVTLNYVSYGDWYSAPVLVSSPAAPGVLLATSVYDSPPTLERYDVSSGKPVAGPRVFAEGGGWMKITPDGQDAVSGGREYKLSDLSADGTYAGGGDTAAITPDGTVAVGNADFYYPDVYVYAPHGSAPLTRYQLESDNNRLVTDGLAWAPDGSRLFAVAQDDYNGTTPNLHPILHILLGANLPAGWLTLTSSSPAATLAQGVTLTGTLTSAVPIPAGESVHVSRTGTSDPTSRSLPDVVPGSDGSFTIKDVPTVADTYTYAVSYDGDATHGPFSTSATVQVSRIPTTLTVTTDAPTYGYGGWAKVTAHLGATYSNRAVDLQAMPADGNSVDRTGTVDANGNLVEYFRLGSDTLFTASFAGDSRYAPASAYAHVNVHAGVAEAQSGYYTTVRYGTTLYRVYHHTRRPVLVAAVAGHKDGECVTFRLQEYYGRAWHSVAGSPCFTLNSSSEVAVAVNLRSTAIGHLFRIDAVYPGDDSNLGTFGAWQYFAIRN